MKILFIGLGSIGLRHLSLIRKHYPDFQIIALRSGKSNDAVTPFDVHSWEEALEDPMPDVAFICTPTPYHILTAEACAGAGLHLFIEKPISTNAENLDRLLSIVEENNLTTYVAYPFRHDPKLNKIKNEFANYKIKLADIICKCDASKWPSKRKLDGAVLELSHEIDYAQYLFGKIVEIEGKDDGDKAELLLWHNGGKRTICHLDIASPIETRSIKWFTKNKSGWHTLVSNQDMYLNQLKYFFDNIDNPGMMNCLKEARFLFKKIMEFKKGGNV